MWPDLVASPVHAIDRLDHGERLALRANAGLAWNAGEAVTTAVGGGLSGSPSLERGPTLRFSFAVVGPGTITPMLGSAYSEGRLWFGTPFDLNVSVQSP